MDETAKTIAGLSKEQIERKIHGAKIIFLYPWTTHRNVFPFLHVGTNGLRIALLPL
jgi:hypothetical protein